MAVSVGVLFELGYAEYPALELSGAAKMRLQLFTTELADTIAKDRRRRTLLGTGANLKRAATYCS